MATPNRNNVADAHARSVMGGQVGWADVTTSTSEETVDLSAWAGLYVLIECEIDDHYFAFMADAATALDTDAAAVGTVGVPEIVHTGSEGKHRVVPEDRPILRYRTLVSAAASLRVIPV